MNPRTTSLWQDVTDSELELIPELLTVVQLSPQALRKQEVARTWDSENDTASEPIEAKMINKWKARTSGLEDQRFNKLMSDDIVDETEGGEGETWHTLLKHGTTVKFWLVLLRGKMRWRLPGDHAGTKYLIVQVIL